MYLYFTIFLRCIYLFLNPLNDSTVEETWGIHHVFSVGLFIDLMAPIPSPSQAYGTWYSQAVSHPNTNQARPCLASEIRWDRRPGWYGHKLRCITWIYYFLWLFLKAELWLNIQWWEKTWAGWRLVHVYSN